MQRQSGLIKVEGRTSTFKGSYLVQGRECGVEANIDIPSLMFILHEIEINEINQKFLGLLPIPGKLKKNSRVEMFAMLKHSSLLSQI